MIWETDFVSRRDQRGEKGRKKITGKVVESVRPMMTSKRLTQDSSILSFFPFFRFIILFTPKKMLHTFSKTFFLPSISGRKRGEGLRSHVFSRGVRKRRRSAEREEKRCISPLSRHGVIIIGKKRPVMSSPVLSFSSYFINRRPSSPSYLSLTPRDDLFRASSH